METFNPEQNVIKYGEKEKDLISRHFNQALEQGIVFCVNSISRYSERYDSQAEKGHNPTDIQKMLDYVNRAIEKAQQSENDYYFILLIDLKSLIESNVNCVDECLFLVNQCFKYASHE